jgi:hypothetical protein
MGGGMRGGGARKGANRIADARRSRPASVASRIELSRIAPDRHFVVVLIPFPESDDPLGPHRDP